MLQKANAFDRGVHARDSHLYFDIYMEVAEPMRQRGVGGYLVQELKRVCYETGKKPAARCDVSNIVSRRTLEKAGFSVCGRILSGVVAEALPVVGDDE